MEMPLSKALEGSYQNRLIACLAFFRIVRLPRKAIFASQLSCLPRCDLITVSGSNDITPFLFLTLRLKVCLHPTYQWIISALPFFLPTLNSATYPSTA